MMRTDLFSARLKACVFVLVIMLALSLTGCGLLRKPPAEAEPPAKEYTVAELAELTGPSIAYIEASDDTFSDYYWFGSGFVVSETGLIITNYHVLEGATRATIEVDGKVFAEPRVLAYDYERDLALIKVEATDLKPLALAESVEEVRLGEKVIAMGNPEGLKRTVSDGIVSTLYRRLEGFDFDHIQTTAPISKGSSGGPLLTMYGKVVGVNTLTYMAGQNLNFAVPIEMVHELLGNQQEPLTIAEVFGEAESEPLPYFEHRPGELAVVLSWEGDADLDLEIWTEDFEFIDIASMLGDCPDIMKGDQGEEWFAFTHYTYLDDESFADYSHDRYIVSVYYYGPEPVDETDEVFATLDVYFPSGERVTVLMEDLWYTPPYDQWFALLVDAGEESVKILDLYLDSPVVAILEWDSEADLDLAIYSDRYDQPFIPGDFWYGYDIMDGHVGLESFRFGSFSNDEGYFDFAHGKHDIFVKMPDTGRPITNASLTLLTDDYEYSRFYHTFAPQPQGDYLWLAVHELEPDSQLFYEPDEEESMIFLSD